MNQVAKKGETFIFLQDMQENVFGAYCSQNLEYREGFFGTGESFLFKCTVNSQ